MTDLLIRFEKYMDRPNKVYFLIGIVYIMSGFYLFFNPIETVHMSDTFSESVKNIQNTPIINWVFNPWFYWISGVGHVLVCGFYYFVNGGWVEL